jgi:hypothetical protein
MTILASDGTSLPSNLAENFSVRGAFGAIPAMRSSVVIVPGGKCLSTGTRERYSELIDDGDLEL